MAKRNRAADEAVGAGTSERMMDILQRIGKAESDYDKQVNGNVRYGGRPYVSAERMRQTYPDFPEGDLATTYSAGYMVGDGENPYQLDLASITKGGQVLSPAEQERYIGGLNAGGSMQELLDSDREGLIINAHQGGKRWDDAFWDKYYSGLQGPKDAHADAVIELRGLPEQEFQESLQKLAQEKYISGEQENMLRRWRYER